MKVIKIVRNAIYLFIFGAGICLSSCKNNNNQSEGAADQTEDSRDTMMETDTLHPETDHETDTVVGMQEKMP